VKCWGNNATGQIGDNTNLNERDLPTAVTEVLCQNAGNQRLSHAALPLQ
jgi:alpha-tubulin suppressor-like RCC1 family protein